MIMAIEIPGITRPHPHLMPITLAARLGLAEITQLLIKRGANVDGYPGGRKSPLIEALGYARRNYTNTNWDAKKPNWSKVRRPLTRG